jgi:hypothetical protein
LSSELSGVTSVPRIQRVSSTMLADGAVGCPSDNRDYLLYVALAVGLLLVARRAMGTPRSAFLRTVAIVVGLFAAMMVAIVAFLFYGLPFILERMEF